MLFSVLFFLTFVYEVARGGLDWGPLKQRPPDDVAAGMMSAERTTRTTIRKVGTEGRPEAAEEAA